MAPESKSSRAGEQTAAYHQKLKTTEQVRVRFARFGDDVLAQVLGFALHPKRMPVLLDRLRLKPGRELFAQLDTVQAFVAQEGAAEFLRRVKLQKRKAVEEADLSYVDDQQLLEEVETGEALGTGRAQPIESAEVREIRRAPPEGLMLKPGQVQSPDYTGTERRAGGDRRAGNDRREDVQVISENRRFGGGRRVFVRRKRDRILLGQEKE